MLTEVDYLLVVLCRQSMQLRFPFRLARGLAVAIAIVFAHVAIAWLFHNMRIPMPYLGPVLVTLLGDAQDDPDNSARPQDPSALAPKSPTAPAPVQVLIEPPQHGSQ
jgi:hypothetical protein